MNKQKHSLRNFAALQSRGSYSKKFLPTSIVTFDTKEANFENDIASEKWLQNQNAFIKIIDLSVILLEKNFLCINALTNLIQSLISLKLVITSVAFFLGHPVYIFFCSLDAKFKWGVAILAHQIICSFMNVFTLLSSQNGIVFLKKKKNCRSSPQVEGITLKGLGRGGSWLPSTIFTIIF